jgi:chromosome segregation ATPase
MLFATMAKDKSQSLQKQESQVEEKPPVVEVVPPESVKMSAEDELTHLRAENIAFRSNLDRVGANWAEGCERISVLERENADLKDRLIAAENANSGLLVRVSELESALAEASPKKSVAELSTLPIGEQLALLEQGLKDTLTTMSELHTEIDKRKAAVAELREVIEVMEPKSYAVPQQGNILPQKGQRVSKHRHPGLFAAIISQGRVGIHFHFVAP